VRTQYAHVIDWMPRYWSFSGWSPRRLSKASSNPRSKVSALRTYSMTAKLRAGTTPSTLKCSGTAPSTRRLAGGLPLARTFLRGGGHRFGNPIPAGKLTELDAQGWSSTTWTRILPKTITSRRESRQADRNDRCLVCRGGQISGHAGGRARHAAHAGRTPPDHQGSHALYLLPHTQAVPYNAGPRLLNRTHSITADVEIPAVERKVPSFRLAAWTADIRST